MGTEEAQLPAVTLRLYQDATWKMWRGAVIDRNIIARGRWSASGVCTIEYCVAPFGHMDVMNAVRGLVGVN